VYRYTFYGLWGILLVSALLVEFIVALQKDFIHWNWIKGIYVAALSITFLLLVLFSHGWIDDYINSPWNSYYLSPDSYGYVQLFNIKSMRTPVYPKFIEMTTLGTGYNHDIGTRPINQLITTSPLIDPLLRTVQIQKILLLGSLIILTIVLIDSFNSLFPATLSLYIYDFNFLTTSKAYILTEALAQTFLILMVACTILYVCKKQHWAIIALGILSALAYLTRPASAYTFWIFLGVGTWGIIKTHLSRKVFYILAALGLWGCILFSYIFLIYLDSGRWTVSTYAPLAHIGDALLVTTPQDINLMPDNDLKNYYRIIAQKVEEHGYKSKTGVMATMDQFNDNIYQIAVPVADEVNKNGSHYDSVELLDKTATIILENHPREYGSLGFEFIRYAVDTSRFNKMGGLISIMIVVLLLSSFLRNKASFCAVVLAFTHVANIVITSFTGVPESRYLAMTEMLVLFAFFILCMEILTRIIYPRLSHPMCNPG
jgi:hypothetical protein